MKHRPRLWKRIARGLISVSCRRSHLLRYDPLPLAVGAAVAMKFGYTPTLANVLQAIGPLTKTATCYSAKDLFG
jgi:hypothetical protein